MKTLAAFLEKPWVRGTIQYLLFVVAVLLAMADLSSGGHGRQPASLSPPTAQTGR